MSITDDIMSKAPDHVAKASDVTLKAVNVARGGIKDAAGTVKGICLILGKGVQFTESSVMNAVRAVAFKKTGDIKYSKNNIDISKLRKSGHVYKVEDHLLAEVMGCFDEQCKKYGIKYSAMKDTRGEGKPDYQPSYMIFFEGRDSDMILSVLQEAWKDYDEKQKQDKEAEERKENQTEEQAKKGWRKNNNKTKDNEPEKRESVKAKLAFFRDRVAARDKERDVMEKHHQHTDIQR